MPTILDGGRLTRVREGMAERGVDALVLGPGPDLLYVAGYAAHTSERLTALVAGLVGTPQLVLPQLEVEGARLHASVLDLVAWSEHEDPATLVADRLRELRSDSDGPLTIAVGDHLWSVFLLRLQSAMPQVEWRPASEVVAPARLVKSGEEIALLRRAASAADRVWEQVSREPLEGLTERAVAARVANLLLAEGAEDVAFNIVASGPHSAAPHHSPGDRVLQKGDMLVLDYGGTLQGYHSDFTRTLSIGPASEEQRRVYAAVQEAQRRLCRPFARESPSVRWTGPRGRIWRKPGWRSTSCTERVTASGWRRTSRRTSSRAGRMCSRKAWSSAWSRAYTSLASSVYV
ncbi:MAG: Xaa-Pro peptidase family protein [Chloroflexia bacterium]